MANKRLTNEIAGYAVANLVGVTIVFVTKYLETKFGGQISGTLIFSEFIIVPLLIGIISAWFWRDLNFSSGKLTGNSCINVLITILLSAIFLGEGDICLVIVSPLLFAFITGGAFLGRVMFKRNKQKLNISIITLLLAVFIVDSVSEHHFVNKVSDTMIVNAPLSRVWKNVVAFKRIKEKNKFWLFRIGMPSPVESTVDGYYLGANRKCIFSNGYTFDEKIITYDQNNNLTFAVTNQPRDPEIMGHIDIEQGQFLLHDNGNGTTTLVGNSWYQLHVFPVWYYDIWAQSITRNVHLRVMQHIKELSEAK
jgi:hypothetical protein